MQTTQPPKIKLLLFSLLIVLTQMGLAQPAGTLDRIAALSEGRNLTVGIALSQLPRDRSQTQSDHQKSASADSLSINGDMRFPMQSVFKFPIALTVLQGVDQGRWQLCDSLFIAKSDLPANTWSPLRERYPEGNIYLTLSELIRYTVAQSDNNGCDILLRFLGGPAQVDDYLRSLGIADINIEYNEAQMHRDWQRQFTNYATPRAMLRLLQLFYDQRLLQPSTQAFLWETMVATSTGSVRTKLPTNAIVAHKTGSSGRNADGISAATNDAGILIRADGQPMAYVVFITNSAEPDSVNAGIIADMAHLLYTDQPTPVALR